MFKGIGSKLKLRVIKKTLGFDSDTVFTWKFGHTKKDNEFVVLIESNVISESAMKKMYNRFLKARYKLPFEAINFSEDLLVPEGELAKISDILLEAVKPKRFVPSKYKVTFIFVSNIWFSCIGDGYLVNFEFVGVHA